MKRAALHQFHLSNTLPTAPSSTVAANLPANKCNFLPLVMLACIFLVPTLDCTQPHLTATCFRQRVNTTVGSIPSVLKGVSFRSNMLLLQFPWVCFHIVRGKTGTGAIVRLSAVFSYRDVLNIRSTGQTPNSLQLPIYPLGSTAVGIQTFEGVVLAAEKRLSSTLLEPDSVNKIVETDGHIGMTSNVDGRILSPQYAYLPC